MARHRQTSGQMYNEHQKVTTNWRLCDIIARSYRTSDFSRRLCRPIRDKVGSLCACKTRAPLRCGPTNR